MTLLCSSALNPSALRCIVRLAYHNSALGTEFAKFVNPEEITVANEEGFRGAKIRSNQYLYHASPSMNFKTFALNQVLANNERYQTYFNGLSETSRELIRKNFDGNKFSFLKKY